MLKVSVREYVLPTLVLLVVVSLLVPLPPLLLDLLLVINFLIAAGLVVVTLQLTDSLHLSSLPTILLLSTLFRLCLNVTSTRMILTYGTGGTVIESFGSFVLGGSVGVGIIIFLMLTLIQFIVVAKGSERVAEVAARFTLDALPGKQMAIDADVRAGLYDMQTARQKRIDLQTESRFYGALDGAMKFVKGDTIAAICIVIINGIGGIVAGLVSGMSLSETFHHYSVLTVGDGLASQIPSLLNSLAAGLVVTRVSGGKSVSLSGELFDQLLRSKAMFRITSGVLISLACIPSLPQSALLIASILIFLVQFLKSGDEALPEEVPITFIPNAIPLLQIIVPLNTSMKIAGSGIESARKIIFEKTGILLGKIPVEFQTNEVIELRLRGITVSSSLVISQENSESDISKTITFFCLKNRCELIDDTLTKRLLDWHEPYMPELVSNTVPHLLSLTQFSEVLRSLVQEDVSLRPFDVILQGIAELHGRTLQDKLLAEELRTFLKRYICAEIISKRKVTISDETIRVALFDDQLQALPWNEGGISAEQIIALKEELYRLDSLIDCVLVSRSVRRAVAEWLRVYGCTVPVVSHSELQSDLMVHIEVRLSLSNKEENDRFRMAA